METPSPAMPVPIARPWYQWHWATWIVLLFVSASLYDRQCDVNFVIEESAGGVGVGYLLDGWPILLVVPFSTLDDDSPQNWLAWPRITNILISLALLASTITVVEWWARSSFQMQFQLRQLVALTTVVCLLLAFTHQWELHYQWANGATDLMWSLVEWRDFARPLRWPILLALGCAIYVIGWGTFTLMRSVFTSDGKSSVVDVRK